MNEPSPNRCRFDEVFSNKTKNTVSCNAVIDIQELNRSTVIICADLSKSKLEAIILKYCINTLRAGLRYIRTSISA